MKKIIALICTLTLCMTLTACRGDSESSGKSKLEGLKFVDNREDEYISLINEFDELENACDMVVVGEFIGDSKVCWDTFTNYNNLTSACLMKITKVLSGDAKVGQLINVLQNEGALIDENEFVAGSQLTPMQKGDEWVFCLAYSDKHADCCDGYYCVGDVNGRYPTKNADSNQKMCFSDYPELGVYERADFNEKFYNELVEKYGI